MGWTLLALEPAYQKPAADPVSQITLETGVIGGLNRREIVKSQTKMELLVISAAGAASVRALSITFLACSLTLPVQGRVKTWR